MAWHSVDCAAVRFSDDADTQFRGHWGVIELMPLDWVATCNIAPPSAMFYGSLSSAGEILRGAHPSLADGLRLPR